MPALIVSLADLSKETLSDSAKREHPQEVVWEEK